MSSVFVSFSTPSASSIVSGNASKTNVNQAITRPRQYVSPEINEYPQVAKSHSVDICFSYTYTDTDVASFALMAVTALDVPKDFFRGTLLHVQNSYDIVSG